MPMFWERAPEILEVLDGPWSTILPERAEARALLGQFLERYGYDLGFHVELFLPLVPHRVARVGETALGRLESTYGFAMYDFHREWPIDGMGVQKDRIEVVLPDGSRQPIFEWLRGQTTRILCPRCGGFLDRTVEQGCPASRHYQVG